VISASAHGTVGVIDDDAPVVGLGSKGVGVSAGAIGFAVGICPIGLTPPTPNSIEPMGTPMRPGAVPVGDDDDAAGLPAVVSMPAQVPDGVPVTMPPPSKSEPVPAFGTPFIPPLKLPATELTPRQVAMLLVGGGIAGDVPDVAGLTPIDPSSVVPSGIPVRGTGAAGPMPSGEVIPSGDGALPPI
jgi:hypothetical protein